MVETNLTPDYFDSLPPPTEKANVPKGKIQVRYFVVDQLPTLTLFNLSALYQIKWMCKNNSEAYWFVNDHISLKRDQIREDQDRHLVGLTAALNHLSAVMGEK